MKFVKIKTKNAVIAVATTVGGTGNGEPACLPTI